MMIYAPILVITLIIWLHFSADFVLQSDEMAINKSKSVKWLLYHGVIYTIVFFPIGVFYALLNGFLHIFVDFFTSKFTKILWEKQERHWFFVAIGFDQAVHITVLILTANYFDLI